MLGKNTVKDIVFRVGRVEKKEQQGHESQEEYARRLNGIQLDRDELMKIEEVVSQVDDEELKDLLRNLFIKQTKFYKLSDESGV